MKKLSILLLNYFILISCSGVPASAPNDLPETNSELNTNAKGAANVTELATGLLQALQANNFEQINTYLPGEEELALLKRRSSQDMKAVLENLTADDYKNNLKAEYEKLVQQGVGKTLNWTDMHVMDALPGKGTRKNKMLQPVEAVFQNKQNQSVRVAFEAVKLNNRYYLFQRMQLKE